ncbi:pseudouridine synthase family protein [Desulfoplanes sp.]
MTFEGERIFYVTPEFDGTRLDAALILAFPDLGLRQRRALWEQRDIRVEGRARPPAFRVRAGQTVDVGGRQVSAPTMKTDPAAVGIHVVAMFSMFAALFKPARVHSVRGKSPGSVEAVLPDLLPGEPPFLLNRLDYLTSGLVLVGRSPESRSRYLSLQDRGQVQKIYLALVGGQVDDTLCIKRAIDSSKRSKVRVLATDNADSLRHTVITPLGMIGKYTLVRAEIRKGQRHQIRAHLAASGHPIVGDPLYGSDRMTDGPTGTMFLHHLKVRMQDFQASCLPDWDLDVRGFIE